MNDDRPGISERVGRVLSRGNLRQREGACDLDTVTALGVVGIQERLADAVFRLKYSNDARSYTDALEGVCGLARVLDRRLRWRMRRPRLRRMAKRTLDYWLNDGCRLCTGVGFEVVRGSPHLSDRLCSECGGTRKRAMPWLRKMPRMPEGRRNLKLQLRLWHLRCDMLTEFAARHRRLLVELEVSERTISEKMAAKLSRRESSSEEQRVRHADIQHLTSA